MSVPTAVTDAGAAAALPLLRLRPIPVAEPWPALAVLDTGEPPGDDQPMLPIDGPRPDGAGPPGTGPRRPALDDGARSGARGGLPEPREWALRFSQVAVEVATGQRPPGHLVRWTSGDVLAALTRRHGLAQRGGGRPPRAVVRSVRLCEPVDAVAEVAAVVADGARVRALAFRMEATGGRWRVCALQLG